MATVSFTFEDTEFKFDVVSNDDLIARNISSTKGFYEADLLRSLRGLLNDGDLVLDVGANIGNHSVFFSAVCGCRVIAFEPVPEAVALLRTNVSMNGVEDRVQIRTHAVGSHAGHARIDSLKHGNLGATSLRDDPGGDLGMFPLDELGLGSPRLVKIDVEGMEMEVLAGARELIASSRPVLVCEAATQEIRRIHSEFLSELGYVPVAAFGATTTVVYLHSKSARERELISRYSARHGAETSAGLLELVSEHRETRKTVIKHTSEIQSLSGQLEFIKIEVQGMHTLAEDIRTKSERFLELSAKVSSLEDRALAAVYDGIRLMQGLESRAVEAAQERASLLAAARLAEQAVAAVPKIDALGARLLDVEARLQEGVGRIQVLQAELSSRETTLREHLQRQDQAGQVALAELSRRFEAEVESANEATQALTRRLEAELASADQKSQSLSDRFDAEVARANESVKELSGRLEAGIESTNQTTRALSSRFDAEVARANESLQSLSRRFDAELASVAVSAQALADSVARVEQQASDAEQAIFSRMDADRSLAEASLRNSLAEYSRDQRNAFEAQAGRLDELERRQGDAREELAARVAALESRFTADLSALVARQMVEGVKASRRERELERKLSAADERLASESKARVETERYLRERVEYVNGRHDSLLNGRIFSTLSFLRSLVSRRPRAGQGTPEQDPGLTQAGEIEQWPIEVVRRQKLERPRAALLAPAVKLGQNPSVSVVMTTYNAREHLVQAVESVIAQTYPHWELVVVDDKSEDGTLDILASFAKRDSRIRFLVSEVNRGTYWAKNRGILASSGDLVTFMDSDDVIDPTRLQKQIAAISSATNAVGSTCNYVRKDAQGEIIMNRGLAERVALISLMVKRQVFQDVGYFDTVRTSADDEMVERIKLAYGRSALPNVAEPLYTALLRESSLSTEAGNANNLDSTDAAGFLSAARLHFARSFSAWHAAVAADGRVPYVPFPSTHRPFPVYGKLRVQGERYFDQPVLAFMATFPARIEHLKRSVASILGQVDHLYVYLNNYEEVPDFLKDPRITAFAAARHADLRDNGKFFHMSSAREGYFLTIDDDIEYPEDYAQRLVEAIETHDRGAVVGVHGVILSDPLDRYFSSGRTVFSFKHALSVHERVHLLGTGTVGFHSSCLRPELSMFPSTGMADVWMAIQAKINGIPMFSIPRGPSWLKPITFAGQKEETLFDEFRLNDTMQTEALRAVGPWPRPGG